jgi:hypothetical protein
MIDEKSLRLGNSYKKYIMRKILSLLVIALIAISCEREAIVTEIDFDLSGTAWTIYKEEVKEEKVGVDGTIRKRATSWNCTNGGCILITHKNQWSYYRDDDVVHDVTYKTIGKIEFTEKSMIVHLKRSYDTVFGEFPMLDIRRNEEYSFNGRNGQTVSGYYFSVSKDGNTMRYNGDIYTRE